MLKKHYITTNISINKSWWDFFNNTEIQELLNIICNQLEVLYSDNNVYPSINNIFKSMDYFNPSDVKVIIMGQDPYHGENEATGLCFHVNSNTKTPPSLRNIIKEICTEYNIESQENIINLEDWAMQGVLLLNSVLTVEKDKPGSHQFLNWEHITTKIIQILNEKTSNKVYILWGKYSETKIKYINPNENLILSSAHPSPFSAYRGFLGNNHFIKTNEYLTNNNIKNIKWFK